MVEANEVLARLFEGLNVPLLRRMVAAELLGRKSGRGFYDYSTTPATPTTLGL